MAKKKYVVVRKKHTRGGRVGGTVVRDIKTGQQKVLLNPHGKYVKAQAELKQGVKFTNDGRTKVDGKGNAQKLSAKERAYRAGYVAAIIDQSRAFNASRK